jgi:6-pyruvoyltetrahydropterin/6-carboxytetrahydropterin synthase
MFELTVEREFCAAHAISVSGAKEPVHGHNWRVQVVVSGEMLDSDGLLCDFHLIQQKLDEAIQPFHNHDLNCTPPFDRLNPTAENVVRHIAQAIEPKLPRNVRLVCAAITEAPGCQATYRPKPV